MPGKAHNQIRTKREAILDAADTLFAKQGYENTTIAEIAQAADVAVGTVYLYFRNKHEIYSNVSIDFKEKISSVFRDPAILTLPLAEVPAAIIDKSFRFCRENMDRMSLQQMNAQTPEEIDQHKQSNEQIVRAINTFLIHIIEQGQLAPFNTEMYAQILNLLVGNVLHQCFALEKGEREELYRKYTIELVQRVFVGPPLLHREDVEQP